MTAPQSPQVTSWLSGAPDRLRGPVEPDTEEGIRRPRRLQLSRRKGYRKPEGAVVVARPSKWGNPYAVARIGNAQRWTGWCITDVRDRWWTYKSDDGAGETAEFATAEEARAAAVELYRLALLGGQLAVTVEDVRRELAGRDLACWCSGACHTIPLLAVANGEEA